MGGNGDELVEFTRLDPALIHRFSVTLSLSQECPPLFCESPVQPPRWPGETSELVAFFLWLPTAL